MPSTSDGFRPASSIALRTAHVPRARVVIPEPRMYVVSPTPTMAYLSRRYLGLVVSVSFGIGMTSPSMLPGLELVELAHEGRGHGRIQLAVEEHGPVRLGEHGCGLLQIVECADGCRLKAESLGDRRVVDVREHGLRD